MLVQGAIYRFSRTDDLIYYQAACTQSGLEFLYPIRISGARLAKTHRNGRRYVLLYIMTKWGKLAATGYWLDPRQGFDKAYVTDATEADLELVAASLEELPGADERLDDILNRTDVELDMEVWGGLLDSDAG
ncbi:MAG: hypothetical protein WDZ49_11045 [Litorilinea sp.]